MDQALHISLRAESLFSHPWPLTNSLFLGFLVLAVIFIFALRLSRNVKLVPAGLQNLVEAGLEKLLKLMEGVLGSRETSERYLPLVGTIFITVLVANWFGLIPGVGSIGLRRGGEFIPFLRSPSADLNFTLALALISVVATNILALQAVGPKIHFKKFFNLTSPINFFVGLLELISECAKVISFSFRLFGNIFAGEVLLVITSFLVPYLVPVPFLLLEIFVGFIQAFVFMMLTLVFIALGTSQTTGH